MLSVFIVFLACERTYYERATGDRPATPLLELNSPHDLRLDIF